MQQDRKLEWAVTLWKVNANIIFLRDYMCSCLGNSKESTGKPFGISFRNALKRASHSFSVLMTSYPKGGLEWEMFPKIIWPVVEYIWETGDSDNTGRICLAI